MTKCVKLQKKLIRGNNPGKQNNKKQKKKQGITSLNCHYNIIDNKNTIQFVIFINNESK